MTRRGEARSTWDGRVGGCDEPDGVFEADVAVFDEAAHVCDVAPCRSLQKVPSKDVVLRRQIRGFAGKDVNLREANRICEVKDDVL
jgi:hypothetical protein